MSKPETTGPPHTVPAKSKRPHGAHRFFVTSLKAGRRLELWGIKQLNQWIELEADPDVQALCERPLVIQDGGRTRCVDFWVSGPKRSSYILLVRLKNAEQAAAPKSAFPAFMNWAADRGCTVEEVDPPDVTEERQRWYRNWTSILQEVGSIRGQLPTSLLEAVRQLAREPTRVSDLIAHLADQGQDLVRAATFHLVYRGELKFLDLGRELVSDESQVAPR
jgi:hypothetical protein